MRSGSHRTGRRPSLRGLQPDASWLIGTIAVALAIAAAIEFVRTGDGRRIAGARADVSVMSHGVARAPIDLYRLLPDATNGIGAQIRVDGTVIEGGGNGGFWVRDLRDNVVRVEEADSPAPGTTVRIIGVLAPLPVAESPDEGPAPPVLGDHALILRDLTVRPSRDGIVVLDRP